MVHVSYTSVWQIRNETSSALTQLLYMAPTAYLIYLIPLWIKVLFDNLTLEDLVAHSDNSIGVWFSFDEAFKVGVFSLKILSFNKMNS